MRKWLWQARPWEAFKTFAILFSFTMNAVLLLVLLLAAPLLLPIVGQIVSPIVGGLNDSFVEMGEARIIQTIDVDDTIPINFTLPLETQTVVTVVEPVPLNLQARVVLPGGGGFINGLVITQLPAGLALPVQLDLSVPVSQTIPVQLAVPVDIPIADTELSGPFSTLQGLFGPLNALLGGLPGSNEELLQRVRAGLPPGEDATPGADEAPARAAERAAEP